MSKQILTNICIVFVVAAKITAGHFTGNHAYRHVHAATEMADTDDS